MVIAKVTYFIYPCPSAFLGEDTMPTGPSRPERRQTGLTCDMVSLPSAHLADIGALLDFVEAFCDQAAINGQDRFDLQLAVEEVCANVMMHGYADRAPGPLEISFCADPDAGHHHHLGSRRALRSRARAASRSRNSPRGAPDRRPRLASRPRHRRPGLLPLRLDVRQHRYPHQAADGPPERCGRGTGRRPRRPRSRRLAP